MTFPIRPLSPTLPTLAHSPRKTLICAALTSLLFATPAVAQQTYSVGNGQTFAAAGVPAAPAAGSLITLGATAAIDGSIQLPQAQGATPSLTLQAPASGSAIALGSAAAPAFILTGPPSVLDLIGPVTFGGANIGGAGLYAGVFLSNAKGSLTIHGDGNPIGFANNNAAAGGAIYVRTDGLTLDNANGTVSATGNRSTALPGGFVYANGDIQIGGSLNAAQNQSASTGGVLYSNSGSVAVTGDLVLDRNTAATGGGGILAASAIAIGGSLSATANTLSPGDYGGGALFAAGGVTVNGSVDMQGNTAGWGGAIASHGNVVLATAGGSGITLTGNQATGNDTGGAIVAIVSANNTLVGGDVTIGDPTSNPNGTVDIENNAATANGGAIYTGGATTIYGGSVTLSGNTSTASGGAIYSNEATSIYANTITLSGNQGQSSGGAIAALNGIALHGSLTANGNSAGTAQNQAGGGALYARDGGIAITGSVDMDGNTGAGGAAALFANNGGNIVLASASGSHVNVSRNDSGIGSGAIFTSGNIVIGDPASNPGASVALADNRAGSNGGAMFAGAGAAITGALTANGNQSGNLGGAIATTGNLTLNANGPMTFSCNTQAAGQSNAVYLGGGNHATLALAAAANQTIAFHDPILTYALGGLVTVNVAGPGRVVFDGAPQTCGSATLAGNGWSWVYANTTVSGGTMAVENGATYGVLAADSNPYLTQATAPTDPTNFVLGASATLAGGNTAASAANSVNTVRADTIQIDGGSTLDVSGSHSLGNPAGTAAGGFSTLHLVGNSVSVGGTIEINACLNDGATPLSDVLDIAAGSGSISGSATLQVTPVPGCAGAPAGNGILLVKTDSANTTATFALAGANANGEIISSGGYGYHLVQVGTNWYLQGVTAPPQNNNGATTAVPTLSRWATVLLGLMTAVGGWAMGGRRNPAWR